MSEAIMKTLGKCWTACGILRIVIGVMLMVRAPTATVMFGALLACAAQPFLWMDIFHVLYVAAIVLSFVCGILGILGGLALVAGRSSARRTLIIASVLAASNSPAGIALSVFTLIRLLPIDSAGTTKLT